LPAKRPHPRARLWVQPAIRSAPLGEERTLLWIGGLRQIVGGRSGRLVPKLIERLRGGEVAEDAIELVASAEGCSVGEVSRVLDVLWERGIVDEEDPGDDRLEEDRTEIAAQIRYLSLFTSRPRRAHTALSHSAVDLFVVPELTDRLNGLLVASGIGTVTPCSIEPEAIARVAEERETRGGHSAAVVVARALEEKWVLECNDELVRHGRSFIAATVSGGGARIGPTVMARESACLRCVYEAERRLASPLPEGVRLPGAPPVATEPVALLDLVAATLALEVVKSLTGLFLPSLTNRRLLIEPASLGLEYETLVKLPRCPSCGNSPGAGADNPSSGVAGPIQSPKGRPGR